MAKAKKKDTYDVEKLLEERKTVTQWLDRLSMASDTTPEDVRVRVKGDYETRLVALNQELKGYSSQITQTLDRATAKLEELKDKEKKAEARLAEAKLRHAVGEYGESKWNEIHSTILGDLVKVREELKETNEEIVRLRDVLASIDSEALEKAQKLQEGARALAAAKAAAEARAALEAGAAERAKAEAEAKAAAEVKAALDIQKKLEEEKKAKEEAQAEAAAREKAEAEAKAKEEAEERAKREAEAKAEAESKARAEAEAEAAAKEEEVPEADAADLPMIDDDSDAMVMDSNVGEDSSFISQQSDFVSSERATGSFMAQDGLPGVEDEGDGELELFDPDEPDEAPVAPSRPSFTPSGIDEPINAPLDQSGGLEAPKDNEASTKTLKCGDCGAMNLPTEWYCESCGAELAAL